MNLIVCLDLRNGISFNKRRQSRDSEVIKRICKLTKSSRLIINNYSQNLFSLPYSNIIISPNPIKEINKNDYYFVERSEDITCLNNIEKLIIYRWDKVYPQSESLPIDLSKFKLISQNEFSGNSHDKITEEIYTI